MAAGLGTRMKSARTKVLHPVLGLPLVGHVVRTLDRLGAHAVTLVVGHHADAVEAAMAGAGRTFVRQDPPQGTGHALLVSRTAIAAHDSLPLLVLSGDVPLLRPETLAGLLSSHTRAGAAATILSMVLPDAGAYGRILRDAAGTVRGIVEARDASEEQRKVREANAGIYVFDVPPLQLVLDELRPDNAQGEYYLTDVIALLSRQQLPVQAVVVDDPEETTGVNSQAELQMVASILRRRRNGELLAAGVRLEQPDTIEVALGAVVEPDATLRPFTFVEGRSVVRTGAVVGPFARLEDAEVGKDAQVLDHCLLRQCVLDEGSTVGPFAHIRPESVVGPGAKVGNFVELKKTTLGPGSKVPHLSYVGDATVGAKVNIGAGTITCNYDGAHKHQTQIGDGAFVGSNSTLVAPVTVGAGAYVGAGSAVTEDVPAGALALGRARQVVKDGWAEKSRPTKK